MEALRQDDPRHFGPYTALARFRETASAVQYLVRDTDSGTVGSADVVVVTAARPALAAVPAFRRRFQSEARTAERLAGGWVQPQLAAPGDGGGPGDLWTAGPYVPALTLAEAIDLAGPLPERPVRILGAALAETLSRVHATGAVLQGLAPETVLLAEDGPRLTAFGPLGAAAAAEARPGGQLSVRLGYLTPEQIEGREVGAASDLFVLGLLLAYAATGTTPLADGPADEAAERIAHASAELGGVPDELRTLIAGCLAKDPADRPGAGSVAAELALEGAAGLARGGWLPGPLSAAVTDQATRVRALEAPVLAAPDTVGAAAGAGGAQAAGAGGAAHATGVAPGYAAPGVGGADIGEDSRTTRFLGPGARAPRSDPSTTQLVLPPQPVAPAAPAAPYAYPPAAPATAPFSAPMQPLPQPVPQPVPAPAPSRGPATSRRALLTAVAAGAGGLVIGGAGAFALGSDDAAPATEDDKPAPRPRRTLPGQPPEPRWVYTHPAAEPAPLTSGLWQDTLLVLTSTSGATGVDLRTGRQVWQLADAAGAQAVLAAGDSLCFLASPTEFLWLSPRDGKVEHRVRFVDQFTGVPNMKVAPLTGASGSVVWFTGSHTVTVKAPKPKKGKKPGKDRQVVKAYLFAYDVEARKELWRTDVPAGRAPGTPTYRMTAVREADIVVRQSAGTLTAADARAARGKASFRCFDRKTGKPLWTKQFGALAPDRSALGDEDGRLYGAVGDDLQAFETATGRPVWTLNGTEASAFGTPVVAGTLLHTTNRNQEVGAVDRETGRLLWRRSTEVPLGGNTPAITLSTGGGTLLAADASQVTAFAAADGRRLWKFQDIGVQDPKGATVSGTYRALAAGKTAVVQRDRVFYAFPVE